MSQEKDEPTLEIVGALATCLTHAIANSTHEQLITLEAELLDLLATTGDNSPAAKVFRSVLREIEQRTAFLARL